MGDRTQLPWNTNTVVASLSEPAGQFAESLVKTVKDYDSVPMIDWAPVLADIAAHAAIDVTGHQWDKTDSSSSSSSETSSSEPTPPKKSKAEVPKPKPKAEKAEKAKAAPKEPKEKKSKPADAGCHTRILDTKRFWHDENLHVVKYFNSLLDFFLIGRM